MERKNKIDELRAQSDRLKAEEEMLNAKVAQMEKELLEAEQEKMRARAEQLEKELMEKEIAELKKQLEVLEEKAVEETQPLKMETVEPVIAEKTQPVEIVEPVIAEETQPVEIVEPVIAEETQPVEAEPEMKETIGDEKNTAEGVILQTDAVPEKSEKKGGKKKVWLILLLTLLLLVGGFFAVFYLKDESPVNDSEAICENKDECSKIIADNDVCSKIVCDNDKCESFANLTFVVNGVPFEMVAVEGGTFKMGAQSLSSSAANYNSEAYSDEGPVHSVTLSDYYMGETEVTQALWQAVMGTNPSHFISHSNPVNKVSYNDCKAFISKLNTLLAEDLPAGYCFQLPTEAEWEYAARGGKHSRGYKYSGSDNIDDVAWYCDNNRGQTHSVKQKRANELGLYDMSGNVYEWCRDWYNREYYSNSPSNNPLGPSEGTHRVIRGGSWDLDTKYCRVSLRNYASPGALGYSNGLRLVLDASPCVVDDQLHESVSVAEKAVFENVINNVCRYMNENDFHYSIPYSPELKSLLDEASSIVDFWVEKVGGYDDFVDEQWFVDWITAQDHETLSYEIVRYERRSSTSVYVYVQFVDSYFGRQDMDIIEFVCLDDNWVINDVWNAGWAGEWYDGWSVSSQETIAYFIERHKDKISSQEDNIEIEGRELVSVWDMSDYEDYEDYDVVFVEEEFYEE